MNDEQRLEILRAVYSEEGENLRFETTTAQRLMTYFGTLELALGAWAAAGAVDTNVGRVVLFILNLLLGACVASLILLNYRRRLEVVVPLRHAIEAMGLTAAGSYLADRPIHAWKVNASWRNWYLALVVLFCAAQALPLFFIEP